MPNQVIRSFPTYASLRNLLLLALLLAHGVGQNFLFSQSIQVTGTEDRKDQLSYRVTANPSQLGSERLWVDAELRNDTDKPISVYLDSTEPSIFQFDIVHEATGRRIPVGQRFFTKNTEPHAGEQKYFKTIGPGKSIKVQIALGGWGSQRCYFRQPGRYVVRPSLHVVVDKVIDSVSGTVSFLSEAWTGDLEAESFAIDVPPEPGQPEIESKIVGSVISHDGKPVADSIVTLQYLGDINIRSELGGFWDQIYSDKNGRFEFVCVPDQVDFLVGAWHPAHSSGRCKFAFDDFKRGEQPIITLPKPVTVRGKVVDSKRLPLGNVRATCLHAEVFTNNEGTFTFVVPDKSIDQGVVVDLWQRGRVPSQRSATRQLAMSGEWEIEIVSEADLNVVGHATFFDGSPLSKMKIEFRLSTLQSEDGGREVTAEKTTDLGVVRLKSEAEDFGWLEGSIAFEGGGSVGGVDRNTYHGITSRAMGGFGPDSNIQDGKFRIKVPTGESGIVFDVYGKGASTMNGSKKFGAEVRRKLVLDLDLEAGKTVHRDLTVPRRENCREVKVRWKGLDEPRLTIATNWRNNTRWIYDWSVHGWAVGRNGERIKNESCTISSFPPEAAFVLATGNMFAIKPVPAGRFVAEISFDQKELGSMQIAVVDAAGLPMDACIVNCQAIVMDEKIPVFIQWYGRKPDELGWNDGWQDGMVLAKFKDGNVTALNLGAAKYSLKVSQASWKHAVEMEVDLAASTSLAIKLQIDTDGKLIEKRIVPVDMRETQ